MLTRIAQRTLEEVHFGQFRKVTFDSKEGKQLHLGSGAQSDLLSQGVPSAQPMLPSLDEGVKQSGPEGRGERAPQKQPEPPSGSCRKTAERLTQQRNRQKWHLRSPRGLAFRRIPSSRQPSDSCSSAPESEDDSFLKVSGKVFTPALYEPSQYFFLKAFSPWESLADDFGERSGHRLGVSRGQ